MSEHTIKIFEEELNKLKFRLVKMGGLVQEQVEFAVKAFTTGNKEIAQLIIEREVKVDKIDIKIDKQCLRIFARHQPLASDLRLVMSALSINSNMEIIGDTAADIAKEVLRFTTPVQNVLKINQIEDMANIVSDMINKVLDSFVYNNVEIAFEVIQSGSLIGKLRRESFDALVEIMVKDYTAITTCSHLIDIIRNLHFISDMAVSIAREIQFLVEAKIAKHSQDTLLGESEDSDENFSDDEINIEKANE